MVLCLYFETQVCKLFFLLFVLIWWWKKTKMAGHFSQCNFKHGTKQKKNIRITVSRLYYGACKKLTQMIGRKVVKMQTSMSTKDSTAYCNILTTIQSYLLSVLISMRENTDVCVESSKEL